MISSNPRNFSFRADKLRGLLLYLYENTNILQVLSQDEIGRFIYHCDLYIYGLRGTPITGSTYIRREDGPFLKELSEVGLHQRPITLLDAQERESVDQLWAHRQELRVLRSVELYEIGEVIPYHHALLPNEQPPLTELDLQRGREIMERLRNPKLEG